MPDRYHPRPRSWIQKFAAAFRAFWPGVRGQSSFVVHAVMATLVVIAAAVFRVTLVEWCILLLCITIVLTAEMLNSALEVLSKAIDANENPHLATGLDIASAAVLTAAMGAALVGAIVFIHRLGRWLVWWS